MMNKPAVVISTTEDKRETTVLDILPDQYKVQGLFPVGRLDKDTEGLLLLSNYGQLAHQLLSLKKHVSKTYFAVIDRPVTEKEFDIFRKGIQLEENFITLPAELKILIAESQPSIEVTIYEGKYHQIKRMFEPIWPCSGSRLWVWRYRYQYRIHECRNQCAYG